MSILTFAGKGCHYPLTTLLLSTHPPNTRPLTQADFFSKENVAAAGGVPIKAKVSANRQSLVAHVMIAPNEPLRPPG